MEIGKNLLLIVTAILVTVAAKDGIRVRGAPSCAGLPPNQEITFPDGDCVHYWICFEGTATLETCPGDLYFNPNTNTCDFPALTGCVPVVTLPPPPASCTGINIGYLPSPVDCNQYIECYEGVGYVMYCPPGYWYTSDIEMCVRPWDSNCRTLTTLPGTTPDARCWGVRPGMVALSPFPGDCSRYYKCTGSQLTVETCPPGLYYNDPKQTCDLPALSGCSDTGPPPPTVAPPVTDPRCADGYTTYWPDPNNCHYYVECFQYQAYEMECPPELYFDSRTNKCVNADAATCASAPPPPTNGPTRPPHYTPDPRCLFGEIYLFPYPGDCTKFYECDEGYLVPVDCPEKLWFNPTLLVCDYPYNSGCTQ